MAPQSTELKALILVGGQSHSHNSPRAVLTRVYTYRLRYASPTFNFDFAQTARSFREYTAAGTMDACNTQSSASHGFDSGLEDQVERLLGLERVKLSACDP